MDSVSFLAAIEVGSHEVILKISQINLAGDISEVESVSKTINLGSESYRLGYISNENIHLLISTLKDFKEIINTYPDAKVSVAATSALREASNKLFIVDQVFRQTGFEIDILSNREEFASMIQAVFSKMPEFFELNKEPTLLLDIGAGSTQLTLFDKNKFLFTQNILLGSLRVRDRLAVLEQHTADFKTLMHEYISGDLDYYRSFVPIQIDYKNLIIVGNLMQTWRYLAELPNNGTVFLSREKFEDLYTVITQTNPIELIEQFDISEEQASILLPMSMVIKEVFELTKLESVILPDVTLADTMIVWLAENLNYRNKDKHIEQYAVDFAKIIARRHHTDFKHIKQVETLALSLFDQLKKLHGLSKRDRFLLQMAANLHNIGKFFTVKQDGVVAYQLIKSSDLPGLTDKEIEMVALLVKYHSLAFTNLVLDNDVESNQDYLILVKLSVILALANTLDTGHKRKVKDLKIEIRKKHVKLILVSNEDLTLESWSLNKPIKFFKDVFGKEIRLKIVPFSPQN
ncbi:MAG: HD domain-containing protein [Clostridiaceae bacterium]|nr:HD domain-containing protein [Clostridiaceae bacterium]